MDTNNKFSQMDKDLGITPRANDKFSQMDKDLGISSGQPDAIDTQIAELSRRGGTDYTTGETKQKVKPEYQPIPYVSKIPYVGNVLNTASKGVMQTIQGVAGAGKDLAEGNFLDAGVNTLRGASGIADTIFSPIIGGFQTATNNPVGREAGDFLSKYIINPVADKISNDPNLQKFAVANPRAEQVFSDTLNVVGSFVGGKKAPKIKTAVTESTKGIKIPTIFQKAPETKVISNIEKELFNIENSYAKTRKAIDYAKDGLQDTRQRIAKTGILADAVDVDGVIRTTQKGGAVDKYTKMTLDDADSLVSNLLQREGGRVKPSVAEKYLTDAVDNSGLVGKALTTAKKNVLDEIEGLKLKANHDGTIPLTAFQDFKVGMTKGIDYNTEAFVKAERKGLAEGARKLIEDISNENIKPINKELAKYLKDIEYLKNLDGRRVKGGRLGKYSAQISGNIIGAFTGSMFGGPIGSAVGSAIGGEVMSAIKGKSMKNVFNKGVNVAENQSPIIKGAIEKSQSPRLALPTPRDELRSVKGSGATIELPAPDYSNNLGNRNTIYNTIPTKTINVINDIIHETDLKVKDLPKTSENFIEITKDLPVEVKGEAFQALQEYNPEVFKGVKDLVETENYKKYKSYQEIKDMPMSQKMSTGDIIKKNNDIKYGFGDSYLGFNLKGMVEQANKAKYPLYDNLIKRVDSLDTIPEKIEALQNILDELPAKPFVNKQGGFISTGVSKDLQPLYKEAQKYKSAEEFVKGNTELTYKNLQENPYSIKAYGKDFDEPVEYYRAGDIKKNGDIWLTDNEAGAKQYSNAGGGTKVGSYIVQSKKPLIIDTAGGKYAKGNVDINKILTKDEIKNGYTNNPDTKQKFIQYAKDNGYDSVQFADSFPDGEGGMRSLVVFDKTNIKTKSQLEQIWKEANAKTSTKQGMTAINPLTVGAGVGAGAVLLNNAMSKKEDK